MSWFSISALVIRSALHRPATRLYPFEQRKPYAKTRGHIKFKIDNCSFCTVCAAKCPTGAIVASKKGKTWAIDHSLCILCGNCVSDCSEGCITQSRQPWPPMRAQDIAGFRQDFATPSAPDAP